jgi:hypothetical protein
VPRPFRDLPSLRLLAVAGVVLLGPVARSERSAAAGQRFELHDERARPCARAVARGGGFTLTATGPGGCPACLCGPTIFSDGFETGDTGAWSATVP